MEYLKIPINIQLKTRLEGIAILARELLKISAQKICLQEITCNVKRAPD